MRHDAGRVYQESLSPMSESMNSVDLAWLRMERPTNPMMIVGVLTFDERIKFAAFKGVLESRLSKFERLKQRPASDVLGTHWETDPYFDIETHCRKASLPVPHGQRELETLAGELASTPLDPNHPLWQFVLVDRYRSGSAVIARFHHCYADGAALLKVLISLTDTEQKIPAPTPASSYEFANATREDHSLFAIAPLFESAMAFTKEAAQGALGWVAGSLRSLSHPGDAAAVARQVGAASAELAKIAMLSEDPRTPLKVPLGTIKKTAWADPLPLEEVKSVGKALDCTINDVLLATVAGALGAHLRRRGVDTDGLTVRAMVPVNLREAADPEPLGNRFGLVFLNLPIGVRNPLARIYALHQAMQDLKHSPQATVALWLLAVMGVMPAAFEERAVELFTDKASVVISNVPGVQQPLYFAGAKIAQQFFWVPQAGSIGLGISILTYNRQVHFGLIADRNVIPEPAAVVDDFAREFETLLLSVVAGGEYLAGGSERESSSSVESKTRTRKRSRKHPAKPARGGHSRSAQRSH